MDGEHNSKSAVEDRSKRIAIGLDSDDDEPIRSLFKLKRPRNLNNKVKPVVDKAESKDEKVGADDGDFGGMDDTLASFRKRLKGPKKDNGSVGAVPLKNNVDKSRNEAGKKLLRKKQNDAKREQIRGDSEVVDILEDLEPRVEDQKEESSLLRDGSDQYLDEKLEDSLSFILKRVQSGSMKKNSCPQQSSRIPRLADGLSPIPEDSKTMKHQSLHNSYVEGSNCVGRSPHKSMKASNNTHRGYSALHHGRTQDELMLDPSIINSQEGGMVDHCDMHRVCDKKCSVSGQGDNLVAHSLKNGLKLCSKGKASSLVSDDVKVLTSVAEKSREAEGLGEHSFKKDVNLACEQMLKDVSSVCLSNVENQISLSSSGKEKSPPLDDNVSCKISSHEIHNPAYGEVLERSVQAIPTAHNIQEVKNAENYGRDSASISLKIEETCDSGNAYGEDKSFPASVSSEKECTGTSNCKLFPVAARSGEVDSAACTLEVNCQGNSLKTSAHSNDHSITIQNYSPVLHQNVSIDDSMKGICVPGHDSINEETPLSVTQDENESLHEDAVSLPDSDIKDGKSSSGQIGTRKTKKRRHEDMTYEGDPDWEILVNDQCDPEGDQVEGDRYFRMREKSDSSSLSVTDVETGGAAAAAVLVGLKARAVGPVEKIKFKEVLKRKGGLQEYLECRNQILSLWSKDVSRILPLTDCGITDTPSEDGSSRASLIKEIYAFLDQSGYINVGIASNKDKGKSSSKHNYKLLEEKTFDVNPGASVADLEDGVSFILGQVKNSATSLEASNGVTVDKSASKTTISRELFTPMKMEVSDVLEGQECPAGDIQETAHVNKILPNTINICADPSPATVENMACITTPGLRNDLQNFQSSCNCSRGDHIFHSEGRKKIIVVGAGPAGLTAARHLQRLGFSVTILEARSRIGGRVYTDRSSLSVPVDLGASIITGVEADVATERRPDPSSLICAQLGLELTVLNSDCPLYDIVTREKVPTDLDEALEAEYNSILDDMVLLIAQKGQHAMKMSLEDGLEYALKRRHAASSGTDNDDAKLAAAEDLYSSESCSVDGGVYEKCSKEDFLSPLERRVMDWHFAHLEYGCAALLKEVSLPYWNQDDVYGGFGGAHCMIKGGYSNVVESLSDGLHVHLDHVVTDILYGMKETGLSESHKVKVSTLNGSEFFGDAVLITVPLGCLKAESIKFYPPLPPWKCSSIQRLGFGVLNKVVLEFPEVFWDDSVDYFGATAEETNRRGHCFMFWNVKKTVGAPVLIALVVGKAALDGQTMSSSDHVSHAVMVLRKLFGEAIVPDPVASVVTDWGRDPFSYGAYSYVAIGSSGEDYDVLGRPVENCIFFAGEATCKEHPDTVGGAMMSGLREAVRIIDILNTGNDHTAEVEAMEAAERHTELERDEVRDITRRLEAVEISSVLYKNSLDGEHFITREALLQEMFFTSKTTAGRLHLVKKLLNLPVETLKLFAGTRKGLATLNSWILDSMGKDGTQLLRHCVRLLVLVSTDLLAVRLSGIGKTVKEKVCVHSSRDIRAIASQLVSVWLEVFRREKASNGGRKLLRPAGAVDSSKRKSVTNPSSRKPPLHSQYGGSETGANMKKVNGKLLKSETPRGLKLESSFHASIVGLDSEVEDKNKHPISKEELAALAAAEAANAAARAAAEAYASAEAKCNTMLQLPKIPSFHKFARREQYAQMDEYDSRKKWSGGVLGRQDCLSEIDSRNCRVRDWPVDFSAACVNLNSSRVSVDNLSQQSHSNEFECQMSLKEQSGETAAVDNSLFTRAWVDSVGSEGIKDYHAIDRWQSQAAAADSDYCHSAMHIKDEEDSNTSSKPHTWKHDRQVNESSISQVTSSRKPQKNNHHGGDRIKQAVVDFVASLLMPVYKARKIDREGYKSIMKKTATKVMEHATDEEKAMAVANFLDSKRKNKIRDFVDKLIERHMGMKAAVNP